MLIRRKRRRNCARAENFMSTFKLAGMTVLMVACSRPAVAFAQREKPITNQDVIELVRLHLSAEVINAKIAESATAFDLSTDGLKRLAQSGVPNQVIRAMQAT